MPGGVGGPRVILGVGFWAQQPYFISISAGPFIFRAPLFARPADPRPKPYQEYPPNLAISTLKPVITAIFRAPIFTTIPQTRKANVDDFVNLAPYRVVVSFRISQLDWPNPTPAKQKAADLTVLAGSAPLYTPNPPVPFSQDLWDSATRSYPKATGDATGTLSPVLTPNPLLPFNQDLWEGAALPKPKSVGEPLGIIRPLLTPNPANPFNQYEWRLTARIPLSLKSEVYWGTFPLYSPNPPNPFNQDLWESATKAFPKAIGEAIAGVAPLLTPNPAQPFAQQDWPRAQDAKAKVAGEPVSSASSLLYPPPFIQSDWFQIRSTQKAKVDDPFNLTIYQPVVVVTVQFAQLDWPSVTPSKAKITDTSTSAWNVLFAPNPLQPFIQSLWDSAVRAFPKVVGEAIGTLNPLLTPNPAAPFRQSLWDSAVIPKPKAYAEPFAATSALYTPNPAQPFRQGIWDLATRAWAKATGEALGGDTPLLTPNPSQPFSQSDWTRILTAAKAKVDDFVNLTPLYAVVVIALPFNQDDWTAVAHALAPQKSDVYRGPNPLLTPNPSAPFSQDLWDSATKAWAKAVGEPIGRVAPLLTPNPAQPFSLRDWPSATNAKAAAKVDTVSLLLPVYSPQRPFNNSTETRTFAFQVVKSDIHVNLLPLQFIPAAPTPFAQFDWPETSGPRTKVTTFHYRPDVTPTAPAAPFPFNLFDWPLPRSAGQIDRSFTFRSQFIPPFVPPIGAQYFLLQPHYINDVYLQAWTIVTEGIEIPFGWIPTLMVDPLNQQAVNAFYAAGPRTGYPGPGYDWQGWQYLTSQRQASIQSPKTFWKQTSPGMYSLTGLGSSLPPIGI